MKTDTRDMVSATEVARDFSRIQSQVADDGRVFVVIKNNVPTAAIVPVAVMERLDRIDELEDDMKLLAVALTRTLTDTGARYALEDVAVEFGVELVD